MRYFDFILTPEDGAIHPVDRAIAETPTISRETLVYVNALGNNTGVMLYRLQGGSEVLKARLDDQPDVISSSVIAVKDETFHLYVHIKSGQPAGKLMAVAQKHALMLIPPFEFTNGGLRVTIAGTHEMIRKCLLELPDDIRVSVEQVGQYSPDGRNVLSLLTERQHEVLETAIKKGYYNTPRRRQASQKDIAEELGCAPSTVDEHLRKAESVIFKSLIR
jgi:predicted DNA binding protein